VFQLFGQSEAEPALDIHMQAALRKQQAFEEWAASPDAADGSRSRLAQQDMVKFQGELEAAQPTPAQIDPATGQDMAPQPQLPQPPSINARTPLAWKPWYNPVIHKQEFLKWANSDVIVELTQSNPAMEQLLTAHLQEMDGALAQIAMQQAMAQQPPKPGGGGIGAGQAMSNSNGESGGAQNAHNPGGKREGAA
jgi:hypothetical protein